MDQLLPRVDHLPQKLFEGFYTTDPSCHRKTTGLGLSIPRRLVGMMDGEITAEKKGENLVVPIRFGLLTK
ncbi:ATP-binding protein [Siminovitchia sp. 179-K 8D1 HS]|uniref:ATP-binding protein n=1 Tax=Siminovitchia sp. 179-K 8D1 HS TaxID=3142385 RepID=UPI0039A20FB8